MNFQTANILLPKMGIFLLFFFKLYIYIHTHVYIF